MGGYASFRSRADALQPPSAGHGFQIVDVAGAGRQQNLRVGVDGDQGEIRLLPGAVGRSADVYSERLPTRLSPPAATEAELGPAAVPARAA